MQHKVAGLLLDKELRFLSEAVNAPSRPFAAIVGGAKVSTKLPVIESLLGKCDKVLLGGGMIFTFYRAMGYPTGNSLVEVDMVPLARDLLRKAEAAGVKIILPSDVVVAKTFDKDSESSVVRADSIPEGGIGMDIGPETLKEFSSELQDCSTIVWNGPMGVFEMPAFAAGTYGIATTLARCTTNTTGATGKGGNGVVTIIGGGDSVSAVNKSGLASSMSHISTGGGASLEMLEGKVLPGVACLDGH